jgi:hypothetical protein
MTRVKIFDVDQTTGEETCRGEFDLAAIIDITEERREVWEELRKSGRYWFGGGAAALVLLTLVKE